MHAVAVACLTERWQPDSMIASVMVGWRREWSIVLARRGRETRMVLGGADPILKGGEKDWGRVCRIEGS